MHDFDNSPITHTTQDALSKSRSEARRPFSHTYFRNLPFEELIAATKLLWNSMCYEKERGGFSDEDLKYMAKLQRHLEKLNEQDREWRLKLDLVLRCLHPDGCFFPYLDKEVIQRAYAMFDVDPLCGVNRLPLRDPLKVVELAAMLEPEVEKIDRKYRRW